MALLILPLVKGIDNLNRHILLRLFLVLTIQVMISFQIMEEYNYEWNLSNTINLSDNNLQTQPTLTQHTDNYNQNLNIDTMGTKTNPDSSLCINNTDSINSEKFLNTDIVNETIDNSAPDPNTIIKLSEVISEQEEKPRARKLIAKHEFSHNKNTNYTRGCLFSPDGLCILTYNDDNTVRLFEPPSENKSPVKIVEDGEESILNIEAAVTIPIAGPIYDVDWYPLLNSSDPGTCCLAVTAQHQPVHLYDAYDGHLRATYR